MRIGNSYRTVQVRALLQLQVLLNHKRAWPRTLTRTRLYSTQCPSSIDIPLSSVERYFSIRFLSTGPGCTYLHPAFTVSRLTVRVPVISAQQNFPHFFLWVHRLSPSLAKMYAHRILMQSFPNVTLAGTVSASYHQP